MQTKKVCRVAAIQMISTDSVRQNLEKIKESVGRCAEKGARLVLLPEYFSFCHVCRLSIFASIVVLGICCL